MLHDYFHSLETKPEGFTADLDAVLAKLQFDAGGLMPVIAQDDDTGTVLMLAWMNQEAIKKTLACGFMTYWSRSRTCFWQKGETSGNRQALIRMRFDCDGDAILCQVKQTRAACHTGRGNCFYLGVTDDKRRVVVTASVPVGHPHE